MSILLTYKQIFCPSKTLWQSVSENEIGQVAYYRLPGSWCYVAGLCPAVDC